MHPKSHYIKLRAKYQPGIIKIIFVLESPPTSGKYFYDPDGETSEPLFSAMMKLIDFEPVTKKDGLAAFARKGLFLVDATYKPVNEIKNPRKRNEAILLDLTYLMSDLRTLVGRRRTKIVLVKKNICEMLEAALKAIGFNVVNDGKMLPFPGSGQQNKFHNNIQEVFKKAKIKIA